MEFMKWLLDYHFTCRNPLVKLKYIRNVSIEMSNYVVLLCTPELYNQAKFILLLLYEFRAKGRDSQRHTKLPNADYSVSCPWLCG